MKQKVGGLERDKKSCRADIIELLGRVKDHIFGGDRLLSVATVAAQRDSDDPAAQPFLEQQVGWGGDDGYPIRRFIFPAPAFCNHKSE
jgi:hypothetical protein